MGRPFQFSLRTLILLVLFLGSLPVLWTRWDAWLVKEVIGSHHRSDEEIFSPDGKYFVVGGNNSLDVIEAASGKKIRTFGEVSPYGYFAFTPDSKFLLICQKGNVLCIWDYKTGQKEAELTGFQGIPFKFAFSPDGKRMAALVAGDGILIWNIETEEIVLKFQTLVSNNGMGDIEFSSDGLRIVTAGHEHVARIWDSRTGDLLVTLSGHRNQVETCAFSKSGQRIVTQSIARGRFDNGKIVGPSFGDYSEIRIWSATGQLINVMYQDVQDVYLAPNEEDLVTDEWDGRTVVWQSRRPGFWWGVAWLPSFWLTLILASGLAFSFFIDAKEWVVGVWKKRVRAVRANI